MLFTVAAMIFPACNSGGHKRDAHQETNDSTARTNVPPLDFKLYMERSGSMVSFDSEHSSGEFKSIVSTLLNRFPSVESSDSTSVYIVNDSIYPYKGSVRDFLAQRDFFTVTKGIGNPAFTDFDQILSMILSHVEEYQVSALVSDLIYSAKGQENVSASKLLNEAYSLTHNTFKDKTNISVILLKFVAGYFGPYYTYDKPSKGLEYKGDRPFYVMLFLSNESLHELYASPDYEAFTKFSTLKNFVDMFCFTDRQYKPAVSIIPELEHQGRFRKEKSHGSSLITGICEVQPSREGELTIPVAVDLSELPLPESYKQDAKLYDVESLSGFRITSVKALDEYGEAEKVRSRMPGATHVLTLETDQKLKNETVSVSLDYRLPTWIARSSTDDDRDICSAGFDSTTFALEPMMKGIFAAYVPDGTSRPICNFEITIKKK